MSNAASVLTLVGCENIKIFSQRKYRVYPVLLVLILAAGILLGRFFRTPRGLLLSDYPYAALFLIKSVFAPLAVFLLTADLFAGEIRSGAIRLYLFRPVSRRKIFLAKILAISLYAGLLFILGFMISCFLASLFSGFFSIPFYSVFKAYFEVYAATLGLIVLSAWLASFTRNRLSCFLLCLAGYPALYFLSRHLRFFPAVLLILAGVFFAGELRFLRREIY